MEKRKYKDGTDYFEKLIHGKTNPVTFPKFMKDQYVVTPNTL